MEKTFLLYSSVHWGDLIEQIKKSLSYTLRFEKAVETLAVRLFFAQHFLFYQISTSVSVS